MLSSSLVVLRVLLTPAVNYMKSSKRDLYICLVEIFVVVFSGQTEEVEARIQYLSWGLNIL